MELIAPYILAFLGIIISLAGFAGIWLIFIAIILSGFIVGFDVIPVWFIALSFIISIVSGLIDNIFIAVGAHRFGASKWGIIGAIIGGLVGLLTANILGVILGPFIGAVAFELALAKKETEDAIKAGVGTFIGYCFSIIIKFLVALGLAICWLLILLR